MAEDLTLQNYRLAVLTDINFLEGAKSLAQAALRKKMREKESCFLIDVLQTENFFTIEFLEEYGGDSKRHYFEVTKKGYCKAVKLENDQLVQCGEPVTSWPAFLHSLLPAHITTVEMRFQDISNYLPLHSGKQSAAEKKVAKETKKVVSTSPPTKQEFTKII